MQNNINLKFKQLDYALVTGAAQRIGKNIAIYLAKQGWNIILHYNKSKNKALELQQYILHYIGRDCILYQENFGKLNNLQFFTKELSVGLIINNAAIFEIDTLNNLTEDDLINTLKINFSTPLLLIRSILNSTSYNKQINIINILDVMIYQLPRNFTSYYFSKYMLANLTKLLAKVYAPRVRVNGIALGQILKNDRQKTSKFNHESINNPLNHKVGIKEIHSTINFIITNQSVTGQIISLDGGTHLCINK